MSHHTKNKNIAVIHNKKTGNNFIVGKMIAENFNCDILSAEDNPSINIYDIIFFVISNIGDEELCQPMEDYIYNLKIRNKKFLVCELGNYFGFESYIGCKKIVFNLLDKLNWEKISDISIDSLPTVDFNSLKNWIKEIKV